MRPIGIRETLRRAIAKLVMRAERDQEKTLCGSLQLCAGIESRIEEATHALAQRRHGRHATEPGGEADEG